MENPEKTREQVASTGDMDVENILKGLDYLTNSMNQIALRTQLKQCDLIICIGCPDKPAFLRGSEAAAPSLTLVRGMKNGGNGRELRGST
ncbi:hypothetical protein JOB18_024219 [Solea senegalensis]|uniref:Uncharacterized protein n=1 Tax=Solea senegalensis TaxID=28829 RepID=A0AAV6SMA9_SOLSE|nr:hypothetical protein JOB18_024219 [Solea senegalensis]